MLARTSLRKCDSSINTVRSAELLRILIDNDGTSTQIAVEVFKVKMDLSPVIMKEIFQYTENPFYDLRSSNKFWRTNIRTMCFGSESIANLDTEICNLNLCAFIYINKR